jgi:ABC-type Fe3+-hydroxamate transport system substrate-binding protein
MRYKSAEDLEKDRQKFLIGLAEVRAHLKRIRDLFRKEKKAKELLSRYEKKSK